MGQRGSRGGPGGPEDQVGHLGDLRGHKVRFWAFWCFVYYAYIYMWSKFLARTDGFGTRGPRVPQNFHHFKSIGKSPKKKFRVPFFIMASGLQWHCFTAKGVYGLWLSSGYGSWLHQSLCMEFAVTALQVYLQLSALISTYLLFPVEDCFFPPVVCRSMYGVKIPGQLHSAGQ